MTAQRFSRIAAVIFAIMALLQLARAITGFDIAIGGETLPVWPSWIAAMLLGFLAYLGLTSSGA